MNVLVVNQQENILSPLNIEVIKTLRGTYSADELISTFTNFFFARMIIDITALQEYEDVVTYQKLSIGLPIDKIILLIPAGSRVADGFFLSKLISMGYYNFTTNGDGVMYLLNTPNTYKEVAHLHRPDIQDSRLMPQQGGMPSQGLMAGANPPPRQPYRPNVRTIGFRNVTSGAGSTSLIYMMKKELEEGNGIPTLCVEIDKRDFTFLRENNMISVDKNTIATELMKSRNYNCVLVDLNDYDEMVCDEIYYLIEPSVIKLNKLMLRDRTVFSRLKGQKVIINRSTLSQADVKEFAQEAGIDIFYVLPPLNDRERSREINDFLRYIRLIG